MIVDSATAHGSPIMSPRAASAADNAAKSAATAARDAATWTCIRVSAAAKSNIKAAKTVSIMAVEAPSSLVMVLRSIGLVLSLGRWVRCSVSSRVAPERGWSVQQLPIDPTTTLSHWWWSRSWLSPRYRSHRVLHHEPADGRQLRLLGGVWTGACRSP